MVLHDQHMVTLTQEVADKVASAILRAERSKKWTADRAGIAVTTFTRKVNGHADFTITELITIAHVLGIEAWQLVPDALRRSEGVAA